jgi:FtsZ-binding cell division protein ZapB
LADDGLIKPNAIVEEYTVRAREAHASLRKTWDSWIENGRPIYAFEQQLENEVIPNEPGQKPQDSQRWRESMGAFLRREGWHESQPTGFTKSERTNLMHILARLDEVQAYRTRFGQTKGEQKLLRHNNPSLVWRAFLKDIGELEVKEASGKKSSLKESVAELQERVDELSEENARLTDAVNEGDWASQITAIVDKIEPAEVAHIIWGCSDEALELADALMAEAASFDSGLSKPLDTKTLFTNMRYMEDPAAFVADNSQKARDYADAILNQLDGQTDEPHDDRLARRIINARGAEAAKRLAAVIMDLVDKVEPDTITDPRGEQAEPSHASQEPPKAKSDWGDGNSGRVWVVNPDGIELVFFSPDAAAAKGGVVHEQPAENFDLKGCHIYGAQYVPKPRTTKSVVRIKGEAVPAEHPAVEPEKKKRGPKPQPKFDDYGRPARPELFDQHIGAFAANDRWCDPESPAAVKWIVEMFVVAEDKRKRGEWVVQKRFTSLADAIAYKNGEVAPPPAEPKEAAAQVPRFGQKRVIGKCRESYFTVAPSEPPGSVERYFLEVYQATDAVPEGMWIRCGGEGWGTHDEAAKFI